jgi:hypothetical protein
MESLKKSYFRFICPSEILHPKFNRKDFNKLIID